MKNERPDFDTKIITPLFILSYPQVWEPKYNELAKRDEYTITMLFDKKTAATDLVAMKNLMKRIAEFKWGVGKVPAGLKNPFRDGDAEKPDNPSFAGKFFVRSWSKQPPGIVSASNQTIISHDEIYGGCNCKAQVNCYAYDQAGNRGISFGLLNLQKVSDGVPFGNRVKAEDAFAPIENAGETTDQQAIDSMFS